MDTIRQLILSPLLGGPPYLAFATLLMLCGMGFPFSSDVTLITGGVLAGTGVFELPTLIPLAVIGILTGDSVAFLAGRRFGPRIIQTRFFRRICPPARFEEISGFLNQNSAKFIFLVRFTPGMRSVIFLTAGTIGVKKRTFFTMDALSTSLYAPTLLIISSFAANRAEKFVADFQAYNRAIAIVFVMAIVAALWYRSHRKRNPAKAVEPT